MAEKKSGWQAARVLGRTVQAGASAIGTGVKNGAASLYQNVQEDIARQKEMKRIETEGTKLAREADRRQTAAAYALRRAASAWDADVRAAETGVLSDYVAFSAYLRRQARLPAQRDSLLEAEAPILRMNLWQDVGTSAVGAGAAGLAAGAGAVGLVTAFGTASTGTALASLTGPAYVHATLAALGGGSLATGGLGMAGGAAVLGAVTFAPAVGVMGFLLDKSIKKNYAQAKKWEQEVRDFDAKSRAACQKSEQLFAALGQKAQLLHVLTSFSGDVLNVGPTAAALTREASYAPILNDTMTTLIGVIELSPAAADFAARLGALEETAARCRQEFYAFVFALRPDEQRFLLGAQQEQLHGHTDDMAGFVASVRQSYERMCAELSDLRGEMHERFDRVDRVGEEIEGALALLGGDLAGLQRTAEAGLAQAAGSRRAIEQGLATLTEKVSARLLDAAALFPRERAREAEKHLAAAFGGDFTRLQPSAQRFLTSASVLLEEMPTLSSALDYSGVCLLAVKALETELKERLYFRYLRYLVRRFPLPDRAADWPSLFIRRDHWGKIRKMSERQFTLGTVPLVCGTHTRAQESDAANERSKDVLLRYAHDELLIGAWEDAEVRELFAHIGHLADYVAQKYRNPAAHVGALREADARDCLDLLVYEEQELPQLLAALR